MIAWRPMIERYWRWWEHVYAIGLVFALTQGPVYKIWRTAEFYTPVPINPTWQATFLAVQIPALMLLARRGLKRGFTVGPFAALVGFLAWMTLSVTWTNLSRYASIDAVALAATTGAGLYVGSRFSSRQFIFILSAAMQIGVISSYYAVKRSWSESIDAEGNWTGIYFNRNSLGPVAMLGLASTLVIMVILLRAKKFQFRIHLLALTGLMVVLDFVVYFRSGSSTSAGAIAVAIVVGGVWLVIGRWQRTSLVPVQMVGRIVYPGFVGFGLLLAWVGFRYQSTIIGWFGKADFFNGRSALWHFSWTGFLEKPIFGWGWRTAWSTPEFLKRDLWWTTADATWSHNAYLEVLLGGGIVGGALFVGYVLWSGKRLVPLIVSSPLEPLRFAVATFVLVACTQEVFVIGNHFLWLSLVAVLTPRNTNE